MHVFWYVITDFGDSGAMLPATAALFLWLLSNGLWRAALMWAGLFAAEVLIVAATKIAFIGWGYGIPAINFTGISGHSTLACSVIPVAAYVLFGAASAGPRRMATLLGFAAGLLIAISRVKLHMHSWSEVIAGCTLGWAIALIFMSQSRAEIRRSLIPAPAMAFAMVVMLLLVHGNRAPSERLITVIALQLSGHDQPFTRRDMRAGWPGPRTALEAPTGSRLDRVTL